MNDRSRVAMSGATVGGTVIALVLAPVVFVVCAFIAGALYALLTFFMVAVANWWVQIMIGIMQGAAGTVAARSACDAVLRSYSPKAIFVEFAAIIVALGAITIYAQGTLGHMTIQFIALAVWLYLAWKVFWKGEDF